MSADAVRPTPAQALGAADLAAHRHLRGHLHHIDRLTPSATPRSFQLLTSCSFFLSGGRSPLAGSAKPIAFLLAPRGLVGTTVSGRGTPWT
jgi:hypothetical protein